MDEKSVDYFIELEVHMLASNEVIKAAYKRLSQKYHPDNGGQTSKLLRIQEAYSVLSDETRRQEYSSQWIKTHVKYISKEDDFIVRHDELLFRPLKKMVEEYMFFIMNHDYDQAYALISIHNQKRLFKKDFILWQKLISEIHELLDYECSLMSVNIAGNGESESTESAKNVIFKVKVKEYNHLLHRLEEDYFMRYVCYENGEWSIWLKDSNIQLVIKKYKRILAINKKNSKQLKKLIPLIENQLSTRGVSSQTFKQTCEYEYLRFARYQRQFTLVSVHLNEYKEPFSSSKDKLVKLLQTYTRITDTFCEYEEGLFLVLLTETLEDEGMQFCKKIKHVYLNEFKSTHVPLRCRVLQVKEYPYGIKEMIDTILAINPKA